MKLKKILLTGVLAGIVMLSGCGNSKSQEVHLASPEKESSVEKVQEEQVEKEPEKEEISLEKSESPEEKDTSEILEETVPETEETDMEEQEEEFSEETAPEMDMPKGVQGCYKLFDTGFEVTVSDPFWMYHDPLSNNMTIYSNTDASCHGFIFHDNSGLGMDQLENEVRNLEDSVEADPTITDLKKEVNDQGNGLFSFTFSYSAGESEGSPAGYFIVHYQKTEQGVISVNFFTERSSETPAIHALVKTIQAVTQQAQDYPQ